MRIASTSRIAVEYVRSRYRVTISRKAASELLCAYSASNLWLSLIFSYPVKTRQQAKPHIRISLLFNTLEIEFQGIRACRSLKMDFEGAASAIPRHEYAQARE